MYELKKILKDIYE